MKKLLTVVFTVTLFLFLFSLFGSSHTQPVFAVGPDPSSSFTPADVSPTPPDNTWVPDADVTFAGKSASRAATFLNWSLTNYKWS
ncbi:MAG: hypothetical protein ACREGI_00330, partial [Candidatus Levyibacteriota bacterium]